ncbi:MAG: hypothetical protein PSV22_19790 [Pseudolabrys sp.]|nr:hypothetical protein [Pseudolabrys sp.]
MCSIDDAVNGETFLIAWSYTEAVNACKHQRDLYECNCRPVMVTFTLDGQMRAALTNHNLPVTDERTRWESLDQLERREAQMRTEQAIGVTLVPPSRPVAPPNEYIKSDCLIPIVAFVMGLGAFCLVVLLFRVVLA